MMDRRKTKADLVRELEAARGRIAALEAACAGPAPAAEAPWAAAEREARYRLVWEAASDVISWHRPSEDLTFLAANPAVLAALGYRAEELIGARATDLIHPADRQAALRSLAETLASGRSSVEVRIRRKGGSYAWLEVAAHFDPRGDGQEAVLCVSRDISRRKAAEEALRLYEMAVEGSPDMIVALSSDYVYRLANQAFLDYHGLRRDQVLGHTLLDVLDVELFGRLKPHIDRCLRGEPVEFDFDNCKGRFDRISYQPLRSPAGETIGLIAIIRDITADRELQRRREVTLGMLELMNARTNRADLLARVGELLKDYCGCEAVGIRLREEGRFPFCHVDGLPADPLGADAIGPGTGCICERVVAERPDGAGGAWTAQGSFWSSSLSAGGAGHCRLAREQGYQSAAVLPLKARTEVLGVLHLYDRRPGLFNEERVASLERFAGSLAIGLAHRRALQALQEREAHLRTILESANDLIYVTDVGSRTYSYVSPSAERILGFAPEEVMRMGPAGYEARVHPEDRGQHTAASRRMAQAHDGGQHEPPLEYRYLHKDGAYRWLSANRRMIFDEQGRHKATVGMVRDMTGRRRGEEALRRSEAGYRLLFENAGVPIFTVNREGVYETMNGTAARMVGGEPEDYVGLTVWDVFPKEVADRQMADVRQVIDSLDVLVTEAPVVLQGQEYWFRTRLAPIVDERGGPRSVQVIAHDITDLKRAEQDLIAYQQHLRTLASELAFAEERERRQIATDLHDHIGQALTIAAMKVGLLSKDAARTRQGKDLREVAGLIERALQASRSLTFELSPPILYDLGLEAAIEWLAESIQEQHGLQVAFSDDGQPKAIDSDVRAMLFKATRELLHNVVKHAHARHAEVSLSRREDSVEVAIRDDGAGFRLADQLRHRHDQGFGLFSIREQIEHLGGQMTIESWPGRGTCVTLRAPLQSSPQAEG
jgi:PAS domain S-box-containing protein